jgi:hypothetical protein
MRPKACCTRKVEINLAYLFRFLCIVNQSYSDVTSIMGKIMYIPRDYRAQARSAVVISYPFVVLLQRVVARVRVLYCALVPNEWLMSSTKTMPI